jgi:hypothetical protein
MYMESEYGHKYKGWGVKAWECDHVGRYIVSEIYVDRKGWKGGESYG